MRYIFKVLILSLDSEFLNDYIAQAFIEEADHKDTYIEWYKEVNVFEDVCDLEIDTIIDVINANYDELLPSVDGIIYFLNPLIKEEIEFFEMILPIINSVKRNIPIIIVYHNRFDILPLHVNELLENLWIRYPDLEGFANLSPSQFTQALQCLCMSMITGDTPLNLENAWMRFPIFIQLANIYFKTAENEQKPEFYYYAAQAIKKAALIAEIFNKNEYFIICDKAASLYAKVNLYLEASKILEQVDKKKSLNYQKLYAEVMLTEGNKLFNRQKYELAAKKYLSVAQWSAIELKDLELMNEAFRLAINSWISACKVEFAFQILDSLPHANAISILNEIADKIEGAVKFLSKQDKLFEAREQLYKTISIYQKENLTDYLEKFTKHLEKILIQIFENQIKENDPYSAKQIYDEIENLWEAYDVKKTDLDKQLEKLIEQFLDALNFGMASILLNKLNSLSLKKKLTKLSSKIEDQYKEEIKKKIQVNIVQGLLIVKEFIEEEQKVINSLNEKVINEANNLIQEKSYLKAANHIKTHANYLKKLGKEEERYQILSKSLDILLVGNVFNEFFLIYKELSENVKKKYLVNKLNLILKIVKQIKIEENFNDSVKFFENFLNVYREQLLYEQSKQIGEIYITFLLNKAHKLVEQQRNLNGIEKVSDLIHKITDINIAYLDKTKRNFDDLYKEIFEICTEIDDLSRARDWLDKIENKMLKEELNKKLNKLDDKKRKSELKKIDETFKEEQLRERFSFMKKKAQSANLDRKNLLNQRKGYQRAYFKEALNKLTEGDFKSAIAEYETSIDRLVKVQQYDLACISLAILSLILLEENRSNEINHYLNKFKSKFSSFSTLISEIFAFSLLEYLVDIMSIEDDILLKESVNLMESLPLFEEEMQLLYKYLGKTYKKENALEHSEERTLDLDQLKTELENYVSQITKEKKDIARRKLMKNQYWRLSLEDLSNNRLESAYLDYFDTILNLLEKKFEKEAALSLIVGTAILINNKNITIGKNKFYEKLTKLERSKSDIEKLPEVKLMKELLFLLDNEMNELANYTLTQLIEKLVLFEPEVNILEKIKPKKKTELEEQQEKVTREDLGKKSKLQIKLDQDLAILKQMRGDIFRERQDFLSKRNPMRKRYYSNVIEYLNKEDFSKAGEEYLSLAQSMVKRKDLQTASLMVLLHGLSYLKENQSIQKIESNINSFLDSLGLNKRLIQETFYIRCIKFILFVKVNKVEKYLIQIQDLLEVLPLFEEEKALIALSEQSN
jgi:hypothetical protein